MPLSLNHIILTIKISPMPQSTRFCLFVTLLYLHSLFIALFSRFLTLYFCLSVCPTCTTLPPLLSPLLSSRVPPLSDWIPSHSHFTQIVIPFPFTMVPHPFLYYVTLSAPQYVLGMSLLHPPSSFASEIRHSQPVDVYYSLLPPIVAVWTSRVGNAFSSTI